MTERYGDRETWRQRDMETETRRQRGKETVRHGDRVTEDKGTQ